MVGIAALAKKWLTGDTSPHVSMEVTSHHLIESLLAELQRLETANFKAAEEVKRLRTEGVNEIRLAVAEECAVICETADYVVRSYGCAREIRLKFGLPIQKSR